MNAGMYGMADGAGISGRKLIFKPPAPLVVNGPGYAISYATGIPQTAAASISTTPVKLVSISGKGAIRGAAVQINSVSAATNLSAKLIIDGVVISDNSVANLVTNGGGICLIGAFSYYASSFVAASLDYVVFNSSVEIWVSSSTINTVNAYVAYDLHQ